MELLCTVEKDFMLLLQKDFRILTYFLLKWCDLYPRIDYGQWLIFNVIHWEKNKAFIIFILFPTFKVLKT